MFQILDPVEKSEQERAAPSSAEPSEHDVELDHFSNYLKAQMKKIPNPKWMDFTMESMMLVKKFVQGEKQPAPIPTASSSPINVVDDNEEVVAPQPTAQVTTMANLNVVPSSTSHNLSSYLASLGTPAIPQPLYGEYLSPRMALMGSPSVHQLMRDVHAPQADKMN